MDKEEVLMWIFLIPYLGLMLVAYVLSAMVDVAAFFRRKLGNGRKIT